MGSRVRVLGLAGRQELNDRLGEVLRFVEHKARWEVRLEGEVSGGTLALRPDNLELLPPHPGPSGPRAAPEPGPGEPSEAPELLGLWSLMPHVLPWLQWPEIRRSCLAHRACSRQILEAVYSRYLRSGSPHGVVRRLDDFAARLSRAQAAQSRGAEDARTAAAIDLVNLQQAVFVLARNCEFYADLFEKLGFTAGQRLETWVDRLLEVLDKVQSFKGAVDRLKDASGSFNKSPACRKFAPSAVED